MTVSERSSSPKSDLIKVKKKAKSKKKKKLSIRSPVSNPTVHGENGQNISQTITPLSNSCDSKEIVNPDSEHKLNLKRKKLKKTKNKPDNVSISDSSQPKVNLETNGKQSCDVDKSTKKPSDVIKIKTKKLKKKKTKKDASIELVITPISESNKINCNSDESDPVQMLKTSKKLKRKKKPADPAIAANNCDKDIVNDAAENIPLKKKKSKKKKKLKQCKDSTNATSECNVLVSPPEILKNKSEDDCNGNNDKVLIRKKRKKKAESVNESGITATNNVQDNKTEGKIKKQKKLKRKISETDPQKKTKVSKKDDVDSNGPNLGQWQTAKLSNDAQQDKFIRLLGGAKQKVVQDKNPKNKNEGSVLGRLTGVWKPPQGKTLWGSLQNKKPKTFSTMALDEKGSEKLTANLESQYNETLAFNLQKRKEGNTAKGLGFQEDPAKGKKHYIDIHKVKSVALD